MPERVVVFLDWQNVYKSAREAFHIPATSPSDCGQVDPLALAELVAKQIPDGELKQVRLYRGIPSNAQDPKGYGAVRKHTAAWKKKDPSRLQVYHRPLQYLPGMAPREKGIDVQLAIDFVVMAVRGEYDTGVLFSTDTDLAPALDAVYELNGVDKPWPRTAGWDGPNRQKRCISASAKRRAPCCWIGTADYFKIRDATRYAPK
jgi:uncharacterized LabA/DUF88 family protein